MTRPYNDVFELAWAGELRNRLPATDHSTSVDENVYERARQDGYCRIGYHGRSRAFPDETVPAFEHYVGIDHSGIQMPAKEAV